MPDIFETAHYRFAYAQSIEQPLVLWESHCHARFEMIAVLEGDISIVLEGKNYRLTNDQAMIIPPLYYHTITANKQGDYRRVTVLFEASSIPEVLQSQFEMQKEAVVFPLTCIDELREICLKQDGWLAPLAEAIMVRSFYACLEAKGDSAVMETDAFLRKATAYMEAHLCEKISLDDLAAVTACSKSSFCHVFREKMKISPKQYILQKKLAFAHKLIREGTPPTVAAFRIGYENYSDFYRQYRKRYGVSPARK